MTAFLDAFALIASINARDSAHPLVKSYLDTYSGTLLTTEWVLLEFADALSIARARPAVLIVLERVHRHPQFEVIGYDRSVYQAGFDLFKLRADKDWSLTDCISFAVMSARGLTEALTADHHFEQAGFHAVFKAT